MKQQTKDLLYHKIEVMKILGLTDDTTETEEYIRVIGLMEEEQNKKDELTDKLIDYNDEIVSIEEVGDLETIDISVTGDSLFFCNDILTKNSLGLAMTADVMVSIFQSDEDRELGIIRLGMMKNRLGPVGSTQAMRIDYGTLSISEAEDVEEDESVEQEMLSTLEMFRGVD